jgi:alpha-L-fucosidase 2
LRARGGFEIVSLEWKNGKVVKAVIKSTLGGNLRMRVPNQMKTASGAAFKNAVGENSNPFYATETIKEPVVSEKATLAPVVLSKTFLYDIATKPGQIITMSAE